MPKPWEIDWSQPQTDTTAKPWERDWGSAERPAAGLPTTPPRVGGQKVLDYTNETLSNVANSAGRLFQNIGASVLHPIDTTENLLKTTTGVVQKMNPSAVPPMYNGKTPDDAVFKGDFRPHADAAWDALKQRYGSVDALANTIKTDPVGVASDFSAIAGGVGLGARGVGVAANAASLPRVASAAGRVAKAASAVSDATNPIRAVTGTVGTAAKALAKPFVNRALGLPGRAGRYGATPERAVLEETSGVTPTAVKASAIARIKELNQQLEQLAKVATTDADLTPVRDVIRGEIQRIQAANGVADDLVKMEEQVTKARLGTAARQTPHGDLEPLQDPMTYLEMKRQFGKDWTKFDSAAPLKNETLKIGNKAYHAMAGEFDRAVPGAESLNQRIQSLVPASEWAGRAAEHAGPVQSGISRATRHSGGLAATLAGFYEGGPLGALAALVGQEALSSPAVKMAIARGLYGFGKAAKSPAFNRTLNAAGTADRSLPPPLDTPPQ